MPYTLYIETDDDFHVIFKGKSYYDCDTIIVDAIYELRTIVAFGNKTEEFMDGIRDILENGLSRYNSVGGNRGIRWTKLDTVPGNDSEYHEMLGAQVIRMSGTIRDLAEQVADLTIERNRLWEALKEATKS